MTPSDDELLEALREALAPPDESPSADRIAYFRAAMATTTAAQDPDTSVVSIDSRIGDDRRRRRSVPAGWLAAAAALLVVAVGVTAIVRRDATPAYLAGGVVEFRTDVSGAESDLAFTVTGTRTGIGRVVEIGTDRLPILPVGEFYEVWFLAPTDVVDRYDRISAGTFHPDVEGVTDVVLTAAVDPAKYPILAITAEPGDGDPRPSSVEVVRGDITIID